MGARAGVGVIDWGDRMGVATAVGIATVDGVAQGGYDGASDCRISYLGRFTEGQEEV